MPGCWLRGQQADWRGQPSARWKGSPTEAHIERSSSADHAWTAVLSVRSGNDAMSKSFWRFFGLLAPPFLRFLVVGGVADDFDLAAEADMGQGGESGAGLGDESVGTQLAAEIHCPA
jgi:hypothetical protein